MTIANRYFVVDAFTERVFGGGPAGVLVTDDWLPDATMQAIAAENNLADTAFVVRTAPARFGLRWFMPKGEIDLNGHATLAAAWCLFERLGVEADEIVFDAPRGPIAARRVPAGITTDGLLAEHEVPAGCGTGGPHIEHEVPAGCATSEPHIDRKTPAGSAADGPIAEHMDTADGKPGTLVAIELPAIHVRPVAIDDDLVAAMGGARPAEAFFGQNYLLVYEREADIAALAPDFRAMARLPHGQGVFATSLAGAVPSPSSGRTGPVLPDHSGAGSDGHPAFDIVGRTFWPKMGVDEDPVCGNMHCNLAPFWSARLGRTSLVSHQLSPRGAVVRCAYDSERDTVTLAGPCAPFLETSLAFL